MKQFQHLGAYGLIIREDEIVLIEKVGGSYNGKLDLPGGTIDWGETPEEALLRELKEEVGIDIKNIIWWMLILVLSSGIIMTN